MRIPPDVIWLFNAGLMWLMAVATPRLVVPGWLRLGTGAVLLTGGVGWIVGARVALARADTTWSPMTPGRTTRLVTTGVYAFSRNPMYLGMQLVLLGWAALLASPAALLVSTGFFLTIDRFQIAPEERALAAGFGPEFLEYKARVRRWI